MELANANGLCPRRPQDSIRAAGFKGGRDYIVVEWLLDNGMMELAELVLRILYWSTDHK